MREGFENWNEIHFDVLREIGNIGAGNAVTALAKLLNKKVDMSVPRVNLVDFKDIASFLGGAENIVIGVLLNLMGDVNGIVMFIVQQDSGKALLNTLMGNSATESLEFSEMELSGLTEIGNILASSYLNSLAGLINKKIRPSVPSLAIDMANAILSVPAIEFGKVADKVLFIESVFKSDEGVQTDVSGYFILVPDMPSFNVILSSLGVM